MEATNEERREVAENLRKQLMAMREDDRYKKDVDVVECGNTAYRNIAWSVELYGNLEKGNYVHIVERLADLIDRPTCKNSKLYKDVFECSECHCCLELITGVCNEYGDPFSVPFMPRYCPNCGAEVMK